MLLFCIMKGISYYTLCTLAVLCLPRCHGSTSDNVSEPEVHSSLSVYRLALRAKRLEHRKAITMLSEIKDAKKQGKLMKPVIEKIFEVLTRSGDYNSSNDFPSMSLKEREGLSTVLENLLFLSDFVLRLPDTTRSTLKKITGSFSRIQVLLSTYGRTSVLEATDLVALDLLAQELNLVERREDYINIYTEKYRIQQEIAKRKAEQEAAKDVKKKTKTKHKQRTPKSEL